ncbi:MAG: conjugative transfer signal peptidase TraF [Vibrionaceae bacterium]
MSLKRFYAAVAVAGWAFMAMAAISYAIGVRINTSKSIPVGLYWVTDTPLEKGAYVLFCPPETEIFAIAKKRNYIAGGFCSGDYGYMMKKILAVKNDLVTVADDGVFVNKKRLPHSQPIQYDAAGRKLPNYRLNRYSLKGSELLLMSDSSDSSFDGRYFGPIERSQVKGVIHLLVAW